MANFHFYNQMRAMQHNYHNMILYGVNIGTMEHFLKREKFMSKKKLQRLSSKPYQRNYSENYYPVSALNPFSSITPPEESSTIANAFPTETSSSNSVIQESAISKTFVKTLEQREGTSRSDDLSGVSNFKNICTTNVQIYICTTNSRIFDK